MSYFSLTPEREKQLIDQIAKFIAESEMNDFLKVFLKTWGLSEVPGAMTFPGIYPFSVAIFGSYGQGLTELMCLNPVKASKRILERVEELEKEKRLREAKTPKQKKAFDSFLKKLSSVLKK